MAGHLIVAVLRNQAKQPLFSVEERQEMIAEVVKPYPNVEIAAFDGLLVDYNLPGATGCRVIEQFQMDFPKVPVALSDQLPCTVLKSPPKALIVCSRRSRSSLL